MHFKADKLDSWRRRAKRVGIQFQSTKNTFKRIKCLDHAVGVLRYFSCKDGQKTGKRDRDGLRTHPHVHYSRQPIEGAHRHDARGKICSTVRDEISIGISEHLNLCQLENWNPTALHDEKECLCDRGEKGVAARRAANEKRKNFYSTEAGIAMKAKYREKAAAKRKLMDMIMKLKVTKKAELCKETMANLLSQL